MDECCRPVLYQTGRRVPCAYLDGCDLYGSAPEELARAVRAGEKVLSLRGDGTRRVFFSVYGEQVWETCERKLGSWLEGEGYREAFCAMDLRIWTKEGGGP